MIRSLLLALALLTGCRTLPFVCTPESCSVLATADLPAPLLGRWRAETGETANIELFRRADDSFVTTAGLLVRADATGVLEIAQVFHFAGDDAFATPEAGATFAEAWVDDPDGRPRRFYRLRAEADTLFVSELDPRRVLAAELPASVRIVDGENMGFYYTDLAEMAATLNALAGDPTVWKQPLSFRKTS